MPEYDQPLAMRSARMARGFGFAGRPSRRCRGHALEKPELRAEVDEDYVECLRTLTTPERGNAANARYAKHLRKYAHF